MRDGSIQRTMTCIDADRTGVFEALIQWETGVWWPRESGVDCFVVEGPDRHEPGKRFRLVFKKTRFVLEMKVDQVVAGERIKHVFTAGPLKGYESWTVEERANGTRVDYELAVEPRSWLSGIRWRLSWRKAYWRYVDAVLKALKDYCEQTRVLAASD